MTIMLQRKYLVMVAGGDRGILDYFHKIEYDSAPVLGIYETDSTGFLAQPDVRELESATSQNESAKLFNRGGLSACC